jgi:hypothetical protein
MTAGVKDYDIRVSAFDTTASVATNITSNASGTSYTDKWASLRIKQTMSEISTFTCDIGGITGVAFSVGQMFGVYYNNGSTTSLIYIGLISGVTYENYNIAHLEGMDMSWRLSRINLPANGVGSSGSEQKWTTSQTSLEAILAQICSPTDNPTWATDQLLPKGTIATAVFQGGKLEIPVMSKQQALLYVMKMFPTFYFYINEETGSLNAASTRGTATIVKDFYLTGTSTNAYLGSRRFTGYDIMNKVTVVGYSGDAAATYADYTTKEATLVCGDKRLSKEYKILTSPDATMYVYDTSDMPTTGYLILRNGSPTSYTNPLFPVVHARIAYTGKTATTITGCTLVASLPIADAVWQVGAPVFMGDVITVDSTTPFANSGEIIIGDEIMTYTSKTATTFQLNTAVTLYTRMDTDSTTLDADIGSTDTEISCTAGGLTGWQASGFVLIAASDSGTCSISGKVATDAGASWTVNGLIGWKVTFGGADTPYYLVVSNTATALTLDKAPPASLSIAYSVKSQSERVYYTSRTNDHLLNCIRSQNAPVHFSGNTIAFVNNPILHPEGVLVKQNTDGVIDATDSSIKLNGVCAYTITDPMVKSRRGGKIRLECDEEQ